MKHKRALVTGGSGLIGSHIVDGLVAEGLEEVVVLDNLTRGRRENLAPALASGRVKIIEGDIRDTKLLREVMEGTMRSTAMIMLIVVAAGFLNFVMSATGITTALTESIGGLGLSPGWMLLGVVVFYVILGCFMETLSMMIVTIPIVAPIMVGLGYDPIWLGIVIVVLVETALITPPVGMNLFVVQSLRKGGSMNAVIIGSQPFVLALFAMVALLAFFPDLAMWLPRVFAG